MPFLTTQSQSALIRLRACRDYRVYLVKVHAIRKVIAMSKNQIHHLPLNQNTSRDHNLIATPFRVWHRDQNLIACARKRIKNNQARSTGFSFRPRCDLNFCSEHFLYSILTTIVNCSNRGDNMITCLFSLPRTLP